MPRTLVISLLIGLIAFSPGAALMQQTPEPAVPLRLGINYFVGMWHDDERAVLDQLPLGFVRMGGGGYEGRGSDVILIQRFVKETREVNNAEPIYQVAALNTTPEEAASVVRQANIEKGLGIKYWSIGNEPNLFKQSHQNDMSIEEYVTLWRACAQAMLAVDPTIVLVGPDVNQMPVPADPGSQLWQWFDAFIKANGDLVGVVAFHYYPFGPQEVPLETITASPDTFAKNLTALRTYLHDTLKRDVPLMITEMNLNWNAGITAGAHGGASLFAGLWLAEIIGISADQGLAAVIPWTAVRDAGLSIIDSENKPRPTYYALQAYADYGTPVRQPADVPAGVKVYASTLANGEVIAVVVNRTGAAVTIKSGLNDPPELTLPPYSFTRYHVSSLKSDAKILDGMTYGQNEFDAGKGPTAITVQK
jgi:hypothetical protein